MAQRPPEILQRAMDAVAAHGNCAAAARALGLPAQTLRDQYIEARNKGFKPQNQALSSWKTENPDVATDSNAPPEGYKIKGTSTLVNGRGETLVQWIKTDRELEQLERMQRAALQAMCEELKPLPEVAAPQHSDEDLATLYTLTDCHIGMLAWDKETGEDWDLNIAEETLVTTLIQMIAAAPNSEVGIVNQLGDFLHFDSLTPMTPTNHHILDADSRYQKVVEVAVRVLRRVITAALAKHKFVRVYAHEGNHDPAGSVWLRVMFSQLYSDNPRVYVEKSPNPYVAWRHGNTLIGFHHGHLAKPTSLPLIFAAKYSKEWGETEYRYVHIGHRHHVHEIEHPGVKVVQHPTLASPDAYAARGGWLSKRQASSITYHKLLGEVGRGIFVPIRKVT